MFCHICGKVLSTLIALLADTAVGAQCPNCGTHLHRGVRAVKAAKNKPAVRSEKLRVAA